MIDQEMRPSVHERLLSAFEASDLSIDADRRTDADYLLALGWAQQRAGRVSGAVLRLQVSTNQSDYRRAREMVVELAVRMNSQRNWRLSALNCRKVGELAMAHHVFPVCPACEGRGREKVEGAPYLGGNICRPCHGTGKRPIQRKFNDEIRAVLSVLEQFEQEAAAAVRRALR